MIRFALCIALIFVFKSMSSSGGLASSTSNPVPFGVHPDLAHFYANEKTFQCLNGSGKIPFELVNDDYCDCSDGSDEPGTSACSNGKFYCPNVGHSPLVLSSSRVNDGICDCCDGSDEQNMPEANCQNKCDEMGAQARREAEEEAARVKEGLSVKVGLIRQGREIRAQKMAEMEKLQKDLEVAQDLQLEKEEKKIEAEEKEKEALDKHNAIQQKLREEREEKQRLEDQAKAAEVFKSIDANGDGLITKDEVLANTLFDQNKDGTVTEEEANFFLTDGTDVNEEDFITTVWVMLKPHLSEDQQNTTTEAPSMDSEITDEDDYSYYEKQNQDGENEDLDDIDDEDEVNGGPKPNVDDSYDADTKELVDIAEAARSEFESVRREATELETKINDIKKSLEKDYGKEDEYAALADQCFEFNDLEYTYKACLFDHCTQRPKNGGSETRLGNWERWDNDFTTMVFSGGQQCWNGPQRSTRITVKCAAETKILDVSEPSKCEYHMTLAIPSACRPLHDQGQQPHDEL